MEIKNKEEFDKILANHSGEIDLDIGCGGRVYGDDGQKMGIDISGATAALLVGDIAFEKIPLPDNSVRKVYASHILEHIPFAIWRPKNHVGNEMERYLPMIHVFNEIFRVLRDDGEFFIELPFINTGQLNAQSFQDPTHVSFWTPETFNYFCGDYYGFHDVYGHTSKFEKISLDMEGYIMKALLKADKK